MSLTETYRDQNSRRNCARGGDVHECMDRAYYYVVDTDYEWNAGNKFYACDFEQNTAGDFVRASH